MADQILNVGSNWGNTKAAIASEATLSELLTVFKASSGLNKKQLDALDKLSKGFKQGDKDDPAAPARRSFGSLKKAANALEQSLLSSPKRFELFNDFLERGAQKPVEALGGQLKGLGDTVATVANSKWLKWFGGGLLGTAVGVVGTSFGLLAGYMQNSLDAFRDLSTYGGNFGNDLLDLRRAALMGNLSLTEFSDLVRENSQLFATIGLNVSDGAKAFSRLSLDVRKFDNYRLKELGFTVSDVNDMLTDYLDVASKTSDIQGDLSRNQAKVVESAVKFGTELNEMSAITGISRKQLAKDIKDQASRGDVMAALMMAQQKGITGVDDKFRSLMLAVAPFGATATKAAGDLMAFRGAFVTEESKSLLKFVPNFAKSLRNYTMAVTSNAPPEAIGEAYDNMLDNLLSNEENLLKMARLPTEAGRQASRILQENAQTFNKYRNLDEKGRKEQRARDKQEAIQRQRMGQSLAKLDEVFRNVQARIMDKIINSNIFDRMVAGLDIVADWFASGDFEYYLNQFTMHLEKGLHYLANIFTPEGREIILKDVSNTFESILLEIRKVFVNSSLYRFLTGDTQKDIAAREAALDEEKRAQYARRQVAELQTKNAIINKQLETEKNAVTIAVLEYQKSRNNELIAIQNQSLDEMKASAKKLWDEAQGTDLATKMQTVWDGLLDSMLNMKNYAVNLFSEEGRSVVTNQIVDMFNKVATFIEGIFVKNPVLRQFLSGETIKGFGFREVRQEAESKGVGIQTELFNKDKEIKDLNEKIEAAKRSGNINEESTLSGKLQSLRQERDNIHLRKELNDQEKKNLDSLSQYNKELMGRLTLEKADKAKDIRTEKTNIESFLTKSRDANIQQMTAEQYMAADAAEKQRINKTIDSNWSDMFKTPMWMSEQKVLSMENDIKNIVERLEKIPRRQSGLEGGYTEAGIYELHDRELVSNPEQQAILGKTLSSARDLALSLQNNNLIGNQPFDIIGNSIKDLFDNVMNKVSLNNETSNRNTEILNNNIKSMMDGVLSATALADRSSISQPIKRTEEIILPKEEIRLDERVKSLSDYSRPEQEQFKTSLDSKVILQDIKDSNDEFLNLFKQHLVYQEQLSRDISDILDYYNRNA